MNKATLHSIAKPTINDIARSAGVSLATVDRVLNERPGVRAVTIARVNRAVDELGYVRDTAAANLARQRVYRFLFLLPDTRGEYFDFLQAHVEDHMALYANERTYLRTQRVPTRNSNEISAVLDSLTIETTDGVALVAPETPTVRDAVARARERGITVVALLTDLPSSPRDHFVGVDNIKAGQTAAKLIGRFVNVPDMSENHVSCAKILVLADSPFSRSFLERRFGFDSLIAQRFAHLSILPTVVMRDGHPQAHEVLPRVFARWPSIKGIYSTTTNNEVLIEFLRAHHPKLSVIAHELTPLSRSALRTRCFDAVISQDAVHIVGSAVRLMRATVDGTPYNALQERSRIEIYVEENLPDR